MIIYLVFMGIYKNSSQNRGKFIKQRTVSTPRVDSVLITEYTDSRKFIRDVIAERVKRNSRYSLRAFARDLGISAPRLSDMIAMRRKMSSNFALKIAKKLNLDAFETEYFCTLVQATDGRTERLKTEAQGKLRLYHRKGNIDESTKMITTSVWNWRHVVILELLKCRKKSETIDATWLANRLKSSVEEITPVLNSLKSDGLILNGTRGFILSKNESTSTTMDIPNVVLAEINRQMLSRAANALSEQDPKMRDYSSYTAAISSNAVPKAKQLINKFRAEMAQLLEADSGDAVYTLAVQFFRQDQP